MKDSSVSINLTDLSINTDEFYINPSHRHAELKIEGGNDGETIRLKVLNALGERISGHKQSWDGISNGLDQSLVFDGNKIVLVDNCVTSSCKGTITLAIQYHDRIYTAVLNINIAS